MREFVVLDVETTGLNPARDHVVEVGAFRYLDGIETDAFCMLVNPGRPIPRAATAVHGIRDADVRSAPIYQTIRVELMRFIGAGPIVAHNASFDQRFLPDLATHNWLCTMQLAKRVWPAAGKYGNASLYRFLNLHPPLTVAHRAAADCRTTAAIINRIIVDMKRQGLATDYHDLMSFLSRSAAINTMPFGKHQGQKLGELPLSYLDWACANILDDAMLHDALCKERTRRREQAQRR